MPELKAGDTKVFVVEGKDLIVEPIPFGSLKKLLKIVMEVMEKGKNGDADVLSVPVLLDKYADQVIPLLFRKNKHEFLTPEWVDENLTVPLLKEIVETAAAVNGVANFFGKTVTPPAPEAVPSTSGTMRTLQENSSSTTPSESPMAGSHAR